MSKAKFQTTAGEIYVPFSAYEIPHSNYLWFREKEQEIYRLTDDKQVELAVSEQEFKAYVIDCVAKFYGDSVVNLPFESNNAGFGSGQDITIGLLYANIDSIIQKFVPTFEPNATNCAVFVNGGKYFIQSATLNNACAYSYLKTIGQAIDLSGLEVIEVLELQRALENQEKVEKVTRNYLYTLDMRTCAILLRLEGEQLPIDTALREAFIKERMKLFSETLPMGDVLNVTFFLTATLEAYVKTRLMPPSLEMKPNRAQRRESAKNKKKPLKTIKPNSQNTVGAIITTNSSKAAGLQKVD